MNFDRAIEFLNIEVTMNREEFRSYRNGEMTLADIKYFNKVDKWIGEEILNNQEVKKLMVGSLATVLFFLNKTMTVKADIGDIDALGIKLLSVVRVIGKWVILIMCLYEIIKCASAGGKSSDIGKVVLKYAIIYACLFFVPWLFDFIAESF